MCYNRGYPLPGGIRIARPRAYRHDVRCPEYGSNRTPKDGTSKGRQVYHCRDCGRRTIPDAAHQRPSAADQERALAVYQEGSLLSAIARIFGVSVPAVSQWVKTSGLKKDARRTVPDAPAGQKSHCWCGGRPAGGGDCF